MRNHIHGEAFFVAVWINEARWLIVNFAELMLKTAMTGWQLSTSMNLTIVDKIKYFD